MHQYVQLSRPTLIHRQTVHTTLSIYSLSQYQATSMRLLLWSLCGWVNKVLSLCDLILTQSNMYRWRGNLFATHNPIAHINVEKSLYNSRIFISILRMNWALNRGRNPTIWEGWVFTALPMIVVMNQNPKHTSSYFLGSFFFLIEERTVGPAPKGELYNIGMSTTYPNQ